MTSLPVNHNYAFVRIPSILFLTDWTSLLNHGNATIRLIIVVVYYFLLGINMKAITDTGGFILGNSNTVDCLLLKIHMTCWHVDVDKKQTRHIHLHLLALLSLGCWQRPERSSVVTLPLDTAAVSLSTFVSKFRLHTLDTGHQWDSGPLHCATTEL